jgi:hypothetical protein
VKRDPDREPDPIEQLEAALADVSAEVGGEASANLDPSDARRRAAGRLTSLVANRGFGYSVSATGDVIVPVEDGSSDIFIRPLELDGEPVRSVSMVVLVEVGSHRALKRLPEALAELNSRHPGVKFCHFAEHGTVFAYVDLPAEGLESPTLLAAMRRLGRVVPGVRGPLADRLGGGRALPGVAQDRGWSLENTFWPQRDG